MPDPLSLALFYLPGLYLGVIAHEAGHALAGRAAGLEVTSLGVGVARPFLVVPIGRMRFYLARSQPFNGLTFAFLPRPYAGWRRMAAFAAGGLLANVVCAGMSLSLAYRLAPGGVATFFGVFAAVNALLVSASLIPFEMKVGQGTLRSDGKLLLDAFRTGTMAPAPPDVIQAAAGLGPLWEAIGDRRMNRLYTLIAAASWIDLGSPDRAEPLVDGSTTDVGIHPHIDWLDAFDRANLALARGEVAGARAALGRMESLADPASPEGRHLLGLLRANLLVVEGEPAKALEAFAGLAPGPAGRGSPGLERATLGGHLRAACVAGDRDAVAGLRERYLGRRRLPSDLNDLHFFGTLARFTSAPEDYRRALKAVAALAAPWRDPGGRAGFLEAQRGLIEDARLVLGEEGMPVLESAGAGPPAGLLTSRDAAFRRWSLRLMLFNASAFAGLVFQLSHLGRLRGGPVGFLALMLALFTIMGVICLLFDRVAGKWTPSLRRSTGFILLATAVMPWVGGAMFVMSGWFDR